MSSKEKQEYVVMCLKFTSFTVFLIKFDAVINVDVTLVFGTMGPKNDLVTQPSS